MSRCPLRWIFTILCSVVWTAVAIRIPFTNMLGFGRGNNHGGNSLSCRVNPAPMTSKEEQEEKSVESKKDKSSMTVLATVLASSSSDTTGNVSNSSDLMDVTAAATTLAPPLASKAGASSLSGGAADQLTYLQTMAAGALSRSMAQTLMHPANTYKTMLQLKGATPANLMSKLTPERLLRGADAQFLLSMPHGALYFFVIDRVKSQLGTLLSASQFSFLQDFAASTISTVFCSIVSTPQMVLTDRLMAGVYPSLPAAMRSIIRSDGMAGFYTGWWPALAQKIPSYGLTWMFFQQLKRLHESLLGTSPSGEVSFGLGAFASATAVAVMIPMDTIKTRLVTQVANNPRAYKGVRDCFSRVLREEGVGAFYRSLPPRLMSVVPMIAIQFGVYETIKAKFLQENQEQRRAAAAKLKQRALSGVSKVKTSAVALAQRAKRNKAHKTTTQPITAQSVSSSSTDEASSSFSSMKSSRIARTRRRGKATSSPSSSSSSSTSATTGGY